MGGCTREAIDAAEAALGAVLPDDLRAAYVEADGWFDPLGQWWVVWPLDRLPEENRMRWEAGVLGRGLVAFGDDGAGDPFCVRTTGGREVLRWSSVDGEADDRWPDQESFRADWCRDQPSTSG